MGEVEVPYYVLDLRGPFTAASNLRAAFDAIKRAPYFKHRVRAFQSSPPFNVSGNDVDEVINAFGKDLHFLNIVLPDNVSHQTLKRLLRECTALRTIGFHESTALTDDLVVLLADQCHHVIFLSLGGAVNITNASVHYLLQHIGPQLLSLAINQCSQLTDSTLAAIVDQCLLIRALDITGTGITADTVISNVIKPNCLPQLNKLMIDLETLKSLNKFVKEEENKANKRWLELLKNGEDNGELSDDDDEEQEDDDDDEEEQS